MSYDYRIPQGRDKGKRTNGMFSLGGKLGSVLSALGNGEKLMQVRLWQNWEMVMGPHSEMCRGRFYPPAFFNFNGGRSDCGTLYLPRRETSR